MADDSNTIQDLVQRKCSSCDSKGTALTLEEAKGFIRQVPYWDLADDGKSISRQYVLRGFAAAVRMINKIAEIAETENHHPDLHLVSYKKLIVVLSTHSIGGLSDDDFIVAAKINQLTAQ